MIRRPPRSTPFPTRRSSDLYERFLDENLGRLSNVTTGSVYWEVISRERRGDYLGATVQVIPHITNEIKNRIGRRSEEHTSELQSRQYLVCRLLLEKKKTQHTRPHQLTY